MIWNTLKQPFPYEGEVAHRIKMAAFFGAFIFFFLLVFKPFELHQYETGRIIFIAGVYGLITFSCVLLCSIVFPVLLPDTFTESNWTTGKQILSTGIIIIIVGLVNYLVSPYLVDTELTLKDALWFQGITISVGLLPVSLFFISKQNKLSKKFSGKAGMIEKELQEILTNEPSGEATTNNQSGKITFIGDYQHEKLELYIDDVHLVTSANNYIKIFNLQKEKLVYSIIRSTLKKTEELIVPYPNLFKCHRAFIINLDKVVHVEGNAQGYKVHIQGYEEPIPVSRNLSTEFSDKLLSFKNRDNLHLSIPQG